MIIMNKKLLFTTIVTFLFLFSFTIALSNNGGSTWGNYKNISVGYHSKTYIPDANTKLYLNQNKFSKTKL